MLTIGICGASGSGKTTLAEELSARIHGNSILINQDAYYRDHPNLSFSEREKLNYDEPAIFEHDLLYQDMRKLIAGEPVKRRAYDFSNHRRADTDAWIEPADVLIIEGIHVFYDARVRDLMDFKIYISVDSDICLLRRVQRDILERRRSVEGIANQYLTTVKPMFERWIRNYVEYADLIVTRGGRNQSIVEILGFYINHGMGKDLMSAPEAGKVEGMSGHKIWYIPDCYWPAGGTDEPYVSHESICVLNSSDQDATLGITLYFEDREPMQGFRACCAARRTHHVRMDKLVSEDGQVVPRGVPYAARVDSDMPVHVQYSRCDTTQTSMAFLSAIPLQG